MNWNVKRFIIAPKYVLVAAGYDKFNSMAWIIIYRCRMDPSIYCSGCDMIKPRAKFDAINEITTEEAYEATD